MMQSGGTARRWTRIAVLTVLAAAMTAAAIQLSLRQGRLARSPFYDDIYYLAQGARWLTLFYEEGVPGTLAEYFRKPPHSPYAVGMAALSFALLGMRDWAPYAANAVAVLACLLLGDWTFRGVGGWRRYGGALLMATLPMTGMTAHEFRPDLIAAVVLVTGIMLVFAGPVGAPGWRMAWAGAAIGASLLCKPSVFAATGLIAGGAVGLASLADWVTARPPLRAFLRPWLLFAAGLLAVAAVYPPAGWRNQWGYFDANILGGWAKHWAGTEDWATHLRWYFDGEGGRLMLGRHLYLLGALLAIGAAHTAVRGDQSERARAMAMTCLLALVYAMVSFNRMKSGFLGLPFQVLLAAATLSSFAGFLRAVKPRAAGSALLAGAIGMGVLVFRLPTRDQWGLPDRNTAAQKRIVSDLYSTVRAAAAHERGKVVMNCIGVVGPDVMNFYSLRDGAGLEFSANQYLSDLGAFERLLDDASFLIAPEPGVGGMFITERYGTAEPFPYAALEAPVIEAVRARPEFLQIAAFPTGPNRESFLVFQRSPAFQGWEAVSGIWGAEGPFPDRDMPVVRWGVGPATKVRVRIEEGRPARLVAIGRCWAKGQVLRIRAGGRELASAPIRPAWTRVETALDLPPGEHVIELSYDTDDGTPQRRGVLYRTLVVLPGEGPGR